MSKKILIVDDDDMTVMCIKNFCKGKDITLDVAADGKEAVSKCKSTAYNMTLVDLNLPDIKGNEVLQNVKAAGGSLGKAVLMSGEDKSGEYAGLGFDIFAKKPINKAKFEELVSSL